MCVLFGAGITYISIIYIYIYTYIICVNICTALKCTCIPFHAFMDGSLTPVRFCIVWVKWLLIQVLMVENCCLTSFSNLSASLFCSPSTTKLQFLLLCWIAAALPKDRDAVVLFVCRYTALWFALFLYCHAKTEKRYFVSLTVAVGWRGRINDCLSA